MHSVYNPCLPMTTDGAIGVKITFTTNITSFIDWFPPICTKQREYDNEYMFDGAQRWNIHNLRVEDYILDNNNGYGFVRQLDGYNRDIVSFVCTQCHFKNITNTLPDRPLFETKGSFHFSAMTLSKISTNAAIISVKHPEPVVVTTVLREFTLIDCHISNITAYTHLFDFDGSRNDVE